MCKLLMIKTLSFTLIYAIYNFKKSYFRQIWKIHSVLTISRSYIIYPHFQENWFWWNFKGALTVSDKEFLQNFLCFDQVHICVLQLFLLELCNVVVKLVTVSTFDGHFQVIPQLPMSLIYHHNVKFRNSNSKIQIKLKSATMIHLYYIFI